MCGIVGAISKHHNVVPKLMNELKCLEYRGYDSAGIAILNAKYQLERIRALGKIQELEQLLKANPLSGHVGIAHTRWATHGRPSEKNAHPHTAGDKLAIVHNGIIENHHDLRENLITQGCTLDSETDSELIAHLLFLKVKNGETLISAVYHTIAELKGAYAVAIISSREPNHIIAIRSGSPLIIGLGEDENYISSDVMSLSSIANQGIIHMEEGDVADIYTDEVLVYNAQGVQVNREKIANNYSRHDVNKGEYSHFMLKEIFDQPSAIEDTLQGRISSDQVYSEAFGFNAPSIFKRVDRVQIVACGTSYHAGLIGKIWLEEIAGIPCQVEIASENRYRKKVVENNSLFVTLSQSGETADTLAALRLAKKDPRYINTLTICNVPSSTIVRESDLTLITHAGPEIGVASTKAFTTQLVSLMLLTLSLGSFHGLHKDTITAFIHHLIYLPDKIANALDLNITIKELAKDFVNKQHALFLGRGLAYPIAMEGALKLKEISYIHAEAYPAGELKHGPLALIDKHMPIIALAPDDDLIDKLKSNLQEVLTRGGDVLVFADAKAKIKDDQMVKTIIMPSIEKHLSPILYVIPLQLLAYHVAALKEMDIDQPRHLAKSVTVE